MSESEVPPPPDGLADSPSWADDSDAKQEEKLWAKEEKLRGTHIDNDITWARIFGYIVASLMVFFTVLFVGSLGAWFFHYLTPWSWLSTDQLSKIQSVVFSGTIGAVVSSYAQKHVEKRARRSGSNEG